MKKTTTSITLGPTILNEWLKKSYNIYKTKEIIIETSMVNTIMTITLVGEKFPNEMNNNEN